MVQEDQTIYLYLTSKLVNGSSLINMELIHLFNKKKLDYHKFHNQDKDILQLQLNKI